MSMSKRELTAYEKQMADRLKDIWDEKRKQLGITQESVAADYEISQGAVGHYLNKRNPLNMKSIFMFARALKIDVSEIDFEYRFFTVLDNPADVIEKQAGLVAEPSAPYRPQSEYMFASRVHGALLSAGNGQPVWEHEEIDNSHAFRKEWLKKRKIDIGRCRVLEVTGDSMAPYLQDGDVVLVNLDNKTIKSGEVYALAVDHELRVKRLYKRTDGALEVSSDNPSPKYRTEVIEPDTIQDLRIIGKVEWRGG